MKFNSATAGPGKEILANDDWAAVPHKFAADAKAGDIVEGKGVCLYDVVVSDNPNGAVVYRGVIDERKLEENQKPTQAQVAALSLIKWLKPDGTFDAGKASV